MGYDVPPERFQFTPLREGRLNERKLYKELGFVSIHAPA